MATSSQYVLIQTRGHAVSTGEAVTRPVYNDYVFRRPSGLFAPNKANILSAFGAAITANLAVVLSVSYAHDFTDCRLLDDPLDPFTTVAGTDNGTVTGDSLPSINNLTLQLKTGLRGGNYRGAKRYGPIAESQTTLDHLNAGGVTAWTAYAAQLLAGFTDSDGNLWTPQVLSQSLSTFLPGVALVVATPVTQIIVNGTLGIMRRRRQPA